MPEYIKQIFVINPSTWSIHYLASLACLLLYVCKVYVSTSHKYKKQMKYWSMKKWSYTIYEVKTRAHLSKKLYKTEKRLELNSPVQRTKLTYIYSRVKFSLLFKQWKSAWLCLIIESHIFRPPFATYYRPILTTFHAVDLSVLIVKASRSNWLMTLSAEKATHVKRVLNGVHNFL